MANNTAVIIGGGVIGLSTAYHLARRGFGRILIFEKGSVGEGASRRAAGIVTGLLWTETGVRARQKSLTLFRELSHELDGYCFQDIGCLNLFDATSWIERAALLPLYDRLTVPYEILSAAEIHRRWPDLTPANDMIGLFDPLGGYSEPDAYIPALTERIRSMGVQIHEHESVIDFVLQGGRVTGVVTANGPIAADAVVSTVHVWTLQLLARLGVQLPIKAFVHQRYVTQPLGRPARIPAVNANPLGGYVRPASGDRLLVGAETAQRAEFYVPSRHFSMDQVSVPADLRQTLVPTFSSLVPRLQGTTWAEERVGLLSFSMDGEPILGPVAALPGLYVGISFHSGGFAYNPVVGLLLAEWIADGQPHMDVAAFSPNRFTAEEIRSHLQTTVTQSDAVARRH